VLHLDVTDEAALIAYVQAVVIPEYCKRPEKVTTVPIREALYWLYDCGTSFAGTTILNSSITRIDDVPAHVHLAEHALAAVQQQAAAERAADSQATPKPAFVLPGLVAW
jgi:hypothetical protein